MSFADELAQVLPADLPHRDAVVAGAARHLELITIANEQFNLTRITTPREAAIKHVLDSVLPWRFFAGARAVMDAGSGPGFPGIPLALVLPEVQFTLAESIQKKARFLQSAVEALGLKNVTVLADRAETVKRIDVITARAVAPLERAVGLFAPAVKAGATALLYKGPDAEAEIAAAARELQRTKTHLNVVHSYQLPDDLGTRTLVAMTRYGRLEQRHADGHSSHPG